MMAGLKRKQRLARWQAAGAELLFPHTNCLICGQPSGGDAWCAKCNAELAALRPCCRCATFIAATETELYRCADCRSDEPGFTLARAAAPYQGELRQNLLAFKYQGRPGLRRPLSNLLLYAYERYYSQLQPDLALPLPLSAQREAERGYNQAWLLTELVAAELGLEARADCLLRRKNTLPLANLTRKQRMDELRGAFVATDAVQGRRILLIDDIHTTGATAGTASRALLKAGAEEVYVLTVAAGVDY